MHVAELLSQTFKITIFLFTNKNDVCNRQLADIEISDWTDLKCCMYCTGHHGRDVNTPASYSGGNWVQILARIQAILRVILVSSVPPIK
jgi:hypothetical protein